MSASTLHYSLVQISNKHLYPPFHTASNAWEVLGTSIHRRKSSFQPLFSFKMPTKTMSNTELLRVLPYTVLLVPCFLPAACDHMLPLTLACKISQTINFFCSIFCRTQSNYKHLHVPPHLDTRKFSALAKSQTPSEPLSVSCFLANLSSLACPTIKSDKSFPPLQGSLVPFYCFLSTRSLMQLMIKDNPKITQEFPIINLDFIKSLGNHISYTYIFHRMS